MHGANAYDQYQKQPAPAPGPDAGEGGAPRQNAVYSNPYNNIKKPFLIKSPVQAAPTTSPSTPSGPAVNPYQKYKEQSLNTMSQGELLIKLYDELIKQMRLAVLTLQKEDYYEADNALYKSERILNALESSLDFQYEISKELQNFYIFFAQQLVEASSKRNPKPVDDCIPLIRDLRDAFEQADKASRSKGQNIPVGSSAL